MIRVCSVHDVPPGEGRAVTVAGRRIAVFHTAERWYALDAACPHAGGPLADGIVADRTVICPLHERRFDLETGEALTQGPCVMAHEVRVHGTSVYLKVAGRRWQVAGNSPATCDLRPATCATQPA
jgi:nitrite reductase (NADH) small subunit